MKWYVADFETTSYKTYLKTNDTRVWLYSIANENEKIVSNGKSIEEFIEVIRNKCKNSIIYFHNLKFDGSFILNYLLNNGYQYKEKIGKKDTHCYTTLIDNTGAYYSIEIRFTCNVKVTIYDSLKLIPLKVSEIAKAFNLPIQKGCIDYNNYIIDNNTLEYVNKDVLIVVKAIKFFKEQDFNKMTIGGNSYNLFKNSIQYHDIIFPSLDNETLALFRKAYRGGRTQVNPLYQGKIINNVKRYDINSMYPYIQSRLDIPYGLPIITNVKGKYKFEIYDIDISFKLKKGHLPTLLKGSNRHLTYNYYENTDGIEHIIISNIDYELLERHYNIGFCRFNKIYGFKTNNKIFKDFIDKYYELKNNSTGGMRLLYKLIINNLYGKYGSNHKGKHKIPTIKDEHLSYITSIEQDMKHYYLPVSIAITSYGHKLIDDAILLTGYNNFVYCDTDSVHTIGSLPNEMVDNKEIGKFKLEGVEDISKYVRTKCYVYLENNEINITCCGLPNNTKEFLIKEYGLDIFNKFDYGLKIDESTPNIALNDLKLLPKQVKGGVVLKPTQFEIRG